MIDDESTYLDMQKYRMRGAIAFLLWTLLSVLSTPALSSADHVQRSLVSAQLLNNAGGDSDTTIVSPLGLSLALCALGPIMSVRARTEVVSEYRESCSRVRVRGESASIWIANEMPLKGKDIEAISQHAEFYAAAAPLNAGISEWLRRHSVPAIVPSLPIVFASVSALSYNDRWIVPFNPTRTKPGTFFGKHHRTSVLFLNGTAGAWMDRSVACRRVIVPTRDGAVILASLEPGVDLSLSCVDKNIGTPEGLPIEVSVPKLTVNDFIDLRKPLEAIGVTSIFDPSSEPFPSVSQNFALSTVLQGIELSIDEVGVTVKSSTLGTSVLSAGPRPRSFVRFDRPFAIRVVGSQNETIALGLMNDLPMR